jgi:hypothetical protein
LHAATQKAFGGTHGPVKRMNKFAEGGFNRVFLLQMEDDFEVIAKIPYRIAGPAFYATASDAATMRFLKAKGFPVPEVYAYCAHADNPVGSEYILLERVSGISVRDRWHDFTEKDIKRLALSVSELEGKLFEMNLGAIGSIYYRKDIPQNQQAPLYADGAVGEEAETFCIGPTADYMFWYKQKATMALDRGPWTDAAEYLQAIARKEITCTEKYGKPIEPDFPHCAFEFGAQQPADFIQSLKDYISLTPYLLPQERDHSFNRPIIRHPDLSPGNVFLHPETGFVSFLIDWQHTIVQPLALAAGIPPTFKSADVNERLDQPRLPEDIDTYSPEEKAEAHAIYRRLLLFHCYRVLASRHNTLHHKALLDKSFRLRSWLIDYAGRQWTGNNFTLRGAVYRIVRSWHLMPYAKGKPCPLHFDADVLERFDKAEDEWVSATTMMAHYEERICNTNEDGWVRNEDFGKAREEIRKIKEEMLVACDDEEDRNLLERTWAWGDREGDD